MEQKPTDEICESYEYLVAYLYDELDIEQYLVEYMRSFPEFKDCNFEVEIVQANDTDSPTTEKIYCDEYGEPLQDADRYIGAAERYTIPTDLREQYVRTDTDIDVKPSYSSAEQLIYGRSGNFQCVDPASLMKKMSQDYLLASPEEELKEIEWRDEFGKPYQPDFCGHEIKKTANVNICDIPDSQDFHNHVDCRPLHIYEPQVAPSDIDFEYIGQCPNVYKVPPMPIHNLPSNELRDNKGHLTSSSPPSGPTRRNQLNIGPLGTSYLRPGLDHITTKLTPVSDKSIVRNSPPKGNTDNVLPNLDKNKISNSHNVTLTPQTMSQNESAIDQSDCIHEKDNLSRIDTILERTNTVQELTKKFSQTAISESERDTKSRVLSPSAMTRESSAHTQHNNEGSESKKEKFLLSEQSSFKNNDVSSESAAMPANASICDGRVRNHHSVRSERKVHNGRTKNGHDKVRSLMDFNDRSRVSSNKEYAGEYTRSSEGVHKVHHRSDGPRSSHSLHNVQPDCQKNKRHRKRHWSPEVVTSKGKRYCYINGEKYKILDLSKSSNKSNTVYRSSGKQSTITPYYSTPHNFRQSPTVTTFQTYGNYQTLPYQPRHQPAYKQIPVNISNDTNYWLTANMQTSDRHKSQKIRKHHGLRNTRSKTIHGVDGKNNTYYNPKTSRRIQEHPGKRDFIAGRSTTALPNAFYPPGDVRYHNTNYIAVSSMPMYGMCADNHMMFDNMPNNTYYNHSMWS